MILLTVIFICHIDYDAGIKNSITQIKTIHVAES